MTRPPRRPQPSRREFLAATAGVLALAASARGANGQARSPDRPEGGLTALSLQQASELLRHKEVSSVDLTQACLTRIEKYQERLNAFITVTPEKALAQARTADEELRGGKRRGPLHGIPLALKDNMDTAGVRTTAAPEPPDEPPALRSSCQGLCTGPK